MLREEAFRLDGGKKLRSIKKTTIKKGVGYGAWSKSITSFSQQISHKKEVKK